METQERIEFAAQELFYRFGIKSVTMDDIAKHLSISKKTIYSFFEDKDQIVSTLCKKDLHNRECKFTQIAEESKNAIDEILLMMKYMSEMFSGMNPNLFYDMQKYHPKAWKSFRTFKEEKVLKMVIENLKKGIEQGLYRKDMDIRIIAKLRVEQVEMAFNPVLFPPDKYKPVAVQMQLLDHFMHGISTLKGHKLVNKYKHLIEEE
ncbi:MAG TPA: TetR/AcrR family transcriptional regulator [Bacteroidia bacterium]|nr:TetR/AcrR family transcriptional regulator [Bacteroidia bacterium]